MKIVIAPDSFKESLTALEVANAIAEGIAEVVPDADCRRVPVADGGEGTVRALVDESGGQVIAQTVTGPLGTPVEAFFGLLGDGQTAVIEMAAASGLELVAPADRDPMRATTRGTGELIRAALDRGVRRVVIGLGGSATNDGGAGMAQALGARLLDADNREIGPGGGALAALREIDISALDPRLASLEVQAACDVTNPLTGDNGASAVFGPQKGASLEMVATLDANLGHYGRLIEAQLGRQVMDLPGGGAAGGLGAGLCAFVGATLRPGIEIVLDLVDFDAQLDGADLVITGEGRIDGQSVHGKTPVGVARRARARGIPVVVLAGSVGEGYEGVFAEGITAVFPIVSGPQSLDDALRTGAANLARSARNLMAVWWTAKGG